MTSHGADLSVLWKVNEKRKNEYSWKSISNAVVYSFQPKITELLDTLDQFRSLGQMSAEDDVRRLEKQFYDLQSQVGALF